MSYVYVRSLIDTEDAPDLPVVPNTNSCAVYDVGFFNDEGEWVQESYHETAEAAAERVNWLNGGTDKLSNGEIWRAQRIKELKSEICEVSGSAWMDYFTDYVTQHCNRCPVNCKECFHRPCEELIIKWAKSGVQ